MLDIQQNTQNNNNNIGDCRIHFHIYKVGEIDLIDMSTALKCAIRPMSGTLQTIAVAPRHSTAKIQDKRWTTVRYSKDSEGQVVFILLAGVRNTDSSF